RPRLAELAEPPLVQAPAHPGLRAALLRTPEQVQHRPQGLVLVGVVLQVRGAHGERSDHRFELWQPDGVDELFGLPVERPSTDWVAPQDARHADLTLGPKRFAVKAQEA